MMAELLLIIAIVLLGLAVNVAINIWFRNRK